MFPVTKFFQSLNKLLKNCPLTDGFFSLIVIEVGVGLNIQFIFTKVNKNTLIHFVA